MMFIVILLYCNKHPLGLRIVGIRDVENLETNIHKQIFAIHYNKPFVLKKYYDHSIIIVIIIIVKGEDL